MVWIHEKLTLQVFGLRCQYMIDSTEYFKWDISVYCIYAKLTFYYGWQSSSSMKITVEQLRRREYFEWDIALVYKLTVGFDQWSFFFIFHDFFHSEHARRSTEYLKWVIALGGIYDELTLHCDWRGLWYLASFWNIVNCSIFECLCYNIDSQSNFILDFEIPEFFF